MWLCGAAGGNNPVHSILSIPYLYKNNYWKYVFYIFSVHGTIYWFYLNIHYSYITFKQKFVEFTTRWTDYSNIFLIVYKCFLNILVSEDRMQTEEMVMWEQWSSVGGDTFICSHTSCFWEHSLYRYKLLYSPIVQVLTKFFSSWKSLSLF